MNRLHSPCLRAIALSSFLVLLTACGGGGGGGDDGPPAPPANQAPVADAGADRSAQPGNTVSLSGTGTDPDGNDTLSSFSWQQTEGTPALILTGADTRNATFTAPAGAAGTAFTFRFTVTDSAGASGSDSVTITVTPPPPANQVPVANAGADQAAQSGNIVTLAGTGTDSDGTIASHMWEQLPSSPSVTLTGANTPNASFTAPTVATSTEFTFRLTVRDNAGATNADSVIVTVTPAPVGNQSPVASAGADQSAQSGTTASLTGSGTDADGTIASFLWQQTGGAPSVTLTGAGTANASFTAPTVTASTALTFRLTVTDNAGATGTDSVVVTVAPLVPTSVTVSGRVTFDRVPPNSSGIGLNYGAITQQSARAVTVQAVANGGALITETVTNASGNYSLTVPPNTQMSVRVLAQMVKSDAAPTWNFKVVDNTAGNATYALSGATFNSGTANVTRDLNAASGFSTSGAATAARSAGPFAILDSVYLAYNKVLIADPVAVFPALVVGWSAANRPVSGGGGSGTCNSNGNIGTSFYTNGNICVLGAAGTDTDEYDDHVLVHEWGHYFEDKFSRSDSVGGPHSGGELLDMRVAFGEGFGNAWSGIVTDDPIYRDSAGLNQSNGFTINVESNPTTNTGWYSESSVQSILYDVYDASQDGAADTVALGITPIYQALTGAQRTGVPLTSIFSFASALKAANTGSAAGINAILAAQNIVGSAIDPYGSTETNSGGSADSLPVYTVLTVNGGAVNRCSTNTFGTYNKLGNRRFFRFSVVTSGLHTFTATGTGADAYMYLYQVNQIGPMRDDSFPPTEQFQATLATGDYVLEVGEFANLDDPGTRTCMNVSVTR